MKRLMTIALALMSLNLFATEMAEYECKGKNISVKVMSVYGKDYHQYLLIQAGKKTTKAPFQFNISLDPTWTSSPVSISDDAREEKGNLIAAKGGHYLRLLAPTKSLSAGDGKEISPATLNSPAVKNGKTINLVCEQMIFG